MEIVLDFNVLIHLIAAAFGILSGFIILYFGIKSNPALQPLAIGQIVASIAIFVNFSLVSELIFHWPFMYRMGHVCILIFLPTPYLFVVFHIKNRRWKWYDLIHLFPLLLFFVDYGHVLVMSNAEKLIILREEVYDLNLLGQFKDSKFIGPGFHEKFRSFLFSFYWMAQVFIFFNWIKSGAASSPRNFVWKRWTFTFFIFQFIMFLPVYLGLFGLDNMTSYHMANSFLVIWLLLSSVSLFFFPSLLYGGVGINEDIPTQPLLKKKPENNHVNSAKLEEVMQYINSQMDEKLLFLTPGYGISDFSKDIDLPIYQVSKTINAMKLMPFGDYINQKRIDYCVSKFGENEWQLFTIEAMASACGFSNRNTFTRAFKKFKGCNPSDFKLASVG